RPVWRQPPPLASASVRLARLSCLLLPITDCPDGGWLQLPAILTLFLFTLEQKNDAPNTTYSNDDGAAVVPAGRIG
ncbi:hypothetical protein, partial [Yersinia intermedia]